MKTLYITDLDGTLLDSTPKTSEYTNATINSLLDQGAVISYATARSLTTTKLVTNGLMIKHPLVVHNGVFVTDPDGTVLHKNIFTKAEAKEILDTILEHEVNPVVFSLIESKQKFMYQKEKLNIPTTQFINKRSTDPRNLPVNSKNELYNGETYYFTLIGDENKTNTLYELFKDRFQCYFQRDMYSGDYWLEITSKTATKATAVKQLAKMLNCDRIVAFGDGINDIEMFSIADEAYAVENAVEDLKAKSTAIIGKNTDDGVAKWIKTIYNKDNK